MGASKTYQFTKHECAVALSARALAHPARVRILSILQDQTTCRNVDLVKELQLSKSAVHNHVQKLSDAGLITFDFDPTCYWIRIHKRAAILDIL